MIKRNNISTHYLDHPLNRSHSKQSHSFSKEKRFTMPKKCSPDKFYDIPSTLAKRSTSFGYRQKTDIVMKQLSDPALYHIKSQFDVIRQDYRYEPKQMIRSKQIKRDLSHIKLERYRGQLQETKNSLNRNKSSKSILVSPGKTSKYYKNEQDNLGKTPFQIERQSTEPRKSAYRLKYEHSQKYLVNNNRSSYTQFLNKKDRRPQKSNHLVSTFGFDERMKEKQVFPNVGPGRYNMFSQFGNNLRF